MSLIDRMKRQDHQKSEYSDAIEVSVVTPQPKKTYTFEFNSLQLNANSTMTPGVYNFVTNGLNVNTPYHGKYLLRVLSITWTLIPNGTTNYDYFNWRLTCPNITRPNTYGSDGTLTNLIANGQGVYLGFTEQVLVDNFNITRPWPITLSYNYSSPLTFQAGSGFDVVIELSEL